MLKYTLAFMVLLGISLISPIGTYSDIMTPAQETTTETGEMVVDPYLVTEPTVVIEGTSGEMAYSYETGELEMTWTHDSGTFLDFSYYGNRPPCEDHIYMSKELSLEPNVTPLAFRGSTDITITTTGDFATHADGDMMFEITIWFSVMDSPWIRVYDIKNTPFGEAREVTFVTDIEKTQAITIYHNLVVYDPTFGIMVSLSPSPAFGGVFGGGAGYWDTLDGSVSLAMRSLSLTALTNITIDHPEPITANYTTDALNSSYFGRGVEKNDAGNLVCFWNSFPYNYADSDEDVHISIDEMTSQHELIRQSSMTLEGYQLIIGFSVADNNVYFTGYGADAYTYGWVAKSSALGSIVWKTDFSLYNNDIGFEVLSDGQGGVYVYSLAVSMNEREMKLFHNLLKFDSSGTFLWNRTIAIYDYSYLIYQDPNELYPTGFSITDDSLIVSSSWEVVSYDMNGVEQWRKEINNQETDVDSEGSIYIFSEGDDGESQVVSWNSAGTELWTTTLDFDFGDDWIASPKLQHMKVADDRYLYLILDYNSIKPYVSIVRLDYLGNTITEDRISNYRYESRVYYRPTFFDLEVTADGLVHAMGYRDYPYFAEYDPGIPVGIYPFNMSLVTYQLSELPIVTPPPFLYDPLSLVMFGASGVIIALVVIDFVRTKKMSIPSNPT